MLGSARGWLAGDTDGVADWRWAWLKWACMGTAQWLVLHESRGRRAAAAWKLMRRRLRALTGAF